MKNAFKLLQSFNEWWGSKPIKPEKKKKRKKGRKKRAKTNK